MQHYFHIQKSHSTSDVPDKKRIFETTDISPIFKTRTSERLFRKFFLCLSLRGYVLPQIVIPKSV